MYVPCALCMYVPCALCMYVPCALCMYVPCALCLYVPCALCMYVPCALCMYVPCALCMYVPCALCMYVPCALCMYVPPTSRVVNADGATVASAGPRDHAAVLGAIVSSVWIAYEEACADQLADDLDALFVTCASGGVAVRKAGGLLVCALADPEAPRGLVAGRVAALAAYLDEPLGLLAPPQEEGTA
jgi:predicted regulator of Ras-like GTPase activity (Roadblock/LC7/MglB family)